MRNIPHILLTLKGSLMSNEISVKLSGRATYLAILFNNLFQDFARANKPFMVVTDWKAGVSGNHAVDSCFFTNAEEAEAFFSKRASNKEVRNTYLFKNKDDISLVRDANSDRANMLLNNLEAMLAEK